MLSFVVVKNDYVDFVVNVGSLFCESQMPLMLLMMLFLLIGDLIDREYN